MKKKIFTPFLIVISILIGLSTLLLSSNYLYRKVISNQPDIKVIRQTNKKDSIIVSNIFKANNKIDTSGVLFFSKNKHKIDSILYGLSFQDIAKDKVFRQKLSDINSAAFINLNPEVFRWIIFHSVSLSLAMASLLFLLFLTIKLFVEFKPYFNTASYVSLLVGSLGAIGFILYVSKNQPLILSGNELIEDFKIIFENSKIAINSIIFPMISVSLFPIVGILLVNIATYFSFEKNIENKTKQELEEKYKDIKGNLNIFALYIGLMVSCAVIGTGLQRDMILSYIGEGNELLYPKELLYAYGIAFSMILALFFIPSYAYLRYAGSDYANKSSEPGKWWEIGKESIDNFKIVLAFILPLLSSIIQPLIKGLV